MKLRALYLLILLVSYDFAFAQDINEDFIKKHLGVKTYQIDTEASAVILFEKATINIELVTNKYKKIYSVYRVVKILNNSAAEEADIRIPFHNSKESPAYVGKIEGITYSLNDKSLVKTPLDKKTIFTRQINKWGSELAFAMPAVTEGTIIEYSYSITSDMTIVMPEWCFQNEHPTLRSEYELIYPSHYEFTSITQGVPHMTEYGSVKDAMTANSQAYKVSMIGFDKRGTAIWGRKNIRALKNEPFVSSLANHVERLDVQLSKYASNSSFMGVEKTFSSWDKFNSSFLEWDDFGKPLNEKKSYLNAIVDSMTKDKATEIAKAKAIYNYIRTSFQCNDSIALTPQENLKNINANKNGNAAALNMLLISMLKKAGLNASAVVLGTVGNLKVSDIYPLIDRYNHTVCMFKTKENDVYFLDASGKYNPFGILPKYCYNGYARVINDEGGAGIVLSPSLIKEREVKSVIVSNLTDTSFDLKITETRGLLASRSTRQWLNANKGNLAKLKDEIINNMVENSTLSAFDIYYLNNPDTNLSIQYSLHHSFNKRVNVVYMQTDYLRFFHSSPFTAMTRQLPIELPYKMDYIYTLGMQIPQKFNPDGLPEPSIITFEKDQMSFRHLVGYDDQSRFLTITTRFTANKTEFPVESYDVIREFFEKMIHETNQVITLKKS